MDEIEHPLRQAGLLEELAQDDGAQRDFFARLKDECVSACDRQREHPQRHHRRKVEGRYARADTQRLEESLAIDPAREVFEGVPKQKREGIPQAYSMFSSPR